jgi:hypothetical protein
MFNSFFFSFFLKKDDALFQIVYDNNIIAVKASSTAQKRQWISQIQHFSALQQYGA